ncbi:hypothetical protein BH10PSE9_BH10PSE9_25770 [soil metagenome]
MIRSGLPLALAALLLATAAATGADDISSFPGVDKLPAGYKAATGFVQGLGIPYMQGDPNKLPTTVYWIHKDKIIGFEVVIDEKQINDRVDVNDIQPIHGLPPIEHIDIDHDFAHARWLNATWTLRVAFVSESYLKLMFVD